MDKRKRMSLIDSEALAHRQRVEARLSNQDQPQSDWFIHQLILQKNVI
jgi:hypothetical protein